MSVGKPNLSDELTSWLPSKKKRNPIRGIAIVKILEFIDKQNCCDYITFIYLLIFSGKIKKEEKQCILLFLIQKGYEILLCTLTYFNEFRHP